MSSRAPRDTDGEDAQFPCGLLLYAVAIRPVSPGMPLAVSALPGPQQRRRPRQPLGANVCVTPDLSRLLDSGRKPVSSPPLTLPTIYSV